MAASITAAGSSPPPASSPNPLHAQILSHLCHSFEYFHRNNLLTDVTLIVENRRIPAHRVILSAISPYFQCMFTSGMREAHSPDVSLRNFSFASLRTILDLIYSNSVQLEDLNLTLQQLEDVLIASDLLQIDFIRSHCIGLLADWKANRHYLNEETCLAILRFADFHHFAELKLIAEEYAVQHFHAIAQTSEFVHLTKDELIRFIEGDDLNVESEEQVYNAVIRWTKHSPEQRQAQLPSILEHVRLPLVQWHFLQTCVSQDDVMQSNEHVLKFVNEARYFQAKHYHPDLIPGVDVLVNSVRITPRHAYVESASMFVAGGIVNGAHALSDTVLQYRPSSNQWTLTGKMRMPRWGFGLCMLANRLYMIGGSDGRDASDVVEVVDLESNEWRLVAKMAEKRSSVVCAVLKGHVYACGGCNDYSSLSSVERYDPDVGSWRLVAPMLEARSMAGCVTFARKMYVCGGYNGYHDLSSVEVYNSQTDQWSTVAPMLTARSMMGVAVLNNLIYVAGGVNHSKSLDSVESFNLAADQWTLVSRMQQPRSGLAAVVVSKRLYIVGGCDGRKCLDTIEVLDEPTASFAICSVMHSARWRFGCCS